jgi:hypothetical protein
MCTLCAQCAAAATNVARCQAGTCLDSLFVKPSRTRLRPAPSACATTQCGAYMTPGMSAHDNAYAMHACIIAVLTGGC